MSEKMKAAALSAAKGLSRVQAERAAANATRNVNAYGQKEEGPSRWQEKKEAKTQMYLESTEKQPTLNQKRCQKCRQTGHWTYECQKPASEAAKPETGSPFSQHVFFRKDERCQKCRQIGHWTYECQKPASEAAKPETGSPFSHGVFLKKDEKAEKSLKKKMEKHSKHKNKKRKHRSRSTSESSDSESDDDRRRKRKKHSRQSKGGR